MRDAWWLNIQLCQDANFKSHLTLWTCQPSYGIIMLLLTAHLCFETASSYILVAPSDTEAQVNQTAFMNCSSSLLSQEVAWYRYRVGDPYRRYDVYDAGVIDKSYRERFYIDGDKTKGVFNLVIKRLLAEDAGKYECQDDGGIGDRRSAELIVLDDEGLVCQSNIPAEGVVGPNDCGFEPTTVELTCGVQFHGNIPPELEWSMERENETLGFHQISLCNSTANQATCNLTTKAEVEMNGSSFACKTTRSTSHRCRIENVNVSYAFSNQEGSEKKLNEKVVCSANSSQFCTYRWKWFEGEYDFLVTSNSELTAERVGWHRCESQCQFGHKTCTVESMVIYVSPQSNGGTEPGCQTAVAVLSTVVAFLLLFIFLIIGFIMFRIYRKRNPTGQSEPLTSPNESTLMQQTEASGENRRPVNEQRFSECTASILSTSRTRRL